VEKQIPNDMLGKNLLNDFHFYYPNSIGLDKNISPQMLRDFFEYNFDFTIVDKSKLDVTRIPYMRYQKEIPNQLLTDIHNELLTNIEILLKGDPDIGPLDDDRKEFPHMEPAHEWRRIWVYKHGVKLPAINNFPSMQKLIDWINLGCLQAFVTVLPPGGFIYPHIDTHNLNNQDYKDYLGCTQLYIPLSGSANNFIKLAGAGIVALQDREPIVINNDHFTHAVVNAGNQPRYLVGLRCHKDILNDCNLDLQASNIYHKDTQ
jgi:hypothetical protein